MRATHTYQKMRDFTEYPNKEISGNQGFWAREASYPCYYASRGRDSSYFCLFSTLKGSLAVFFALSGCLAEFWNDGNAALF